MKVHGLLYHDVVAPGHPDESGFPGQAAGRYKLDWAELERHLDAIATAGLDASVRADGLDAAGPPPVLLTFDDGGSSALPTGAALAARGWIGHFFVPTDRLGSAGFLDADQVRLLAESGHVIGSHSRSHPARISSLPRERLLAEWRESVEVLEDIVGSPITVASVPGGYYSRAVARAAAESGIRVLFTSEPVATARSVGGCLILGRYSIQRGTPAGAAAALASGALGPRLLQAVKWNSKKLLKGLAGGAYPVLRRTVLDRR